MRVLLIEDDPMIGKSLKQALQNESMTVDWTRSGVEGEEALSTDDYAAVLLDLNLPDRNHRPPPRLVAHAAQPCRRRDPRDGVGAGRDERHEGSVQFGTPRAIFRPDIAPSCRGLEHASARSRLNPGPGR